MANDQRRGSATTDEGDNLSWRMDGTGPSMLIMNGLVSSIDPHWTRWVDHYRKRLSVITWDYRGHGDSTGPTDLATATIEQFADDAASVLADAQADHPAVVCGLSMGVQTSLEFYRRHPDKTKALVLICGTAGLPLNRIHRSPALRSAMTKLTAWLELLPPSVMQAIMYPFAGTRLGPEMAFLTGGATRGAISTDDLSAIFAHATGRHPALFARLAGSYFNHSAWEMLDTIDVPTLIIAGDKDDLTPVATSEEMHRRIPDSELYIVHGHGHLAQVEKPEELHAVVDAFIEKHDLA